MSRKVSLQFGVRMFVAFIASVGVIVSLQSENVLAANSPNTLKVSPVRTDISVKQGDKRIVKMTVTNLTSEPLVVHPGQNDFIAGDERGTPALILDETKFAPTHSLKRYMKPLADVTIPPKQAKTIDVLIEVPTNAQAGGYFGAIRFAPAAPAGGGQVNLSTSVASLILLTIPGDAIEKLELTDFKIQQNGKAGSFFTKPDNIEISTRFRNDGNVQLGPFGKISVSKGDKVVYDVDFNANTPKEMALPDSARRWEIPVEKLEDFGHYKVNATFTYGSKNQTIEIEQSFWVVPVGIIVAIIGGIIGLIALIAGIVLFLRSYKKRILQNNSHRRRSSYGSRR